MSMLFTLAFSFLNSKEERDVQEQDSIEKDKLNVFVTQMHFSLF
jgi:hypothetical protein